MKITDIMMAAIVPAITWLRWAIIRAPVPQPDNMLDTLDQLLPIALEGGADDDTADEGRDPGIRVHGELEVDVQPGGISPVMEAPAGVTAGEIALRGDAVGLEVTVARLANELDMPEIAAEDEEAEAVQGTYAGDAFGGDGDELALDNARGDLVQCWIIRQHAPHCVPRRIDQTPCLQAVAVLL